ncbi:hypothetical protein ACHWQZ_G008187 [Mnemiopsis leidyi]
MTFILSVDQGTSSTRAVVIDCNTGVIVAEHNVVLPNIFPKEGFVEILPQQILDTTYECIDAVVTTANSKGIPICDIAGLGITNQRETTVVWDATTGKPLYNAIVWLDNRTNETVKKLVAATPTKTASHFQSVVGLPISPYFSAVKLRWLLDNVPEVAGEGVLFGTVDTWLIWNLTRNLDKGDKGVHVTDVTNASRTMLMNLETLDWDDSMCKFFGVSKKMLPKICSSAEIYGHISHGSMAGKPIAGCLGDQQAALFGQHCFLRGEAKCTYGTGCFMLTNTGTDIVQSKHGLLTTVAYKIGSEPAVYALEGAVAIGGEVVRWLRDNLGIISSSSEVEQLSGTVDSSHDLYFVPAFSGLYAPYWDPTARGLIIGITAYSNSAHIARAALEAVCFQVCEILQSMDADSGIKLQCLRSDGGMTKNQQFLRMQADVLGIPVECRAESSEATAMGAGMAAAKALGVWNVEKLPGDVLTYNPDLGDEERNGKLARWRDAVQRSRGWVN